MQIIPNQGHLKVTEYRVISAGRTETRIFDTLRRVIEGQESRTMSVGI